MTSTTLELEELFRLPAAVLERFFPEKKLTFRDLITFGTSLPPTQFSPTGKKADDFYSCHLPLTDVINDIILHREEAIAQGCTSIIYAPLPVDSDAVQQIFPLCVATLWYGLEILKQEVISPWTRAVLHLQSPSLSSSKELVEQAEEYLCSTVWWGKAYGFDRDADEIIDELLRQHICDSPRWANRVKVPHMMFFVRLHNAHGKCRDCPSLYNSDENQWLRKLGGLLETGHREYVVGALNVNHNHWISIIVNVKDNIIYYGGPMHGVSKLVTSRPQLVASPTFTRLHISHGEFTFSEEFPLLASDQVDSGRLRLFIEIMERHHRMSKAVQMRTSHGRFTFSLPSLSNIQDNRPKTPMWGPGRDFEDNSPHSTTPDPNFLQ
ncbi:hypothetical protein M422DRAFT_259532 [Sphaerobolus stellatus SS14]|uniref:Ubiquitin-like protease family profile domain-containing protein n=1 Tax=Sphaerobolus stellatus (strain SS14) TaxID=990650 RepID=A0A0C9U4S2_SPHS4|nr:hypothetical protein M422DRAFT_259532 [Sphaerobolus stellatus SS14]